VGTISFKLLYGLVILSHARRRLVSIRVTNNPTAEWIAGQVTDAFPWDEAPRHLIRDRCSARRTCAVSWRLTLRTTMRSGRISHWIKMLHIFGGPRSSAASQPYVRV